MLATPAPAALLPRKHICRILVDSLADRDLTNAQMANAREIVARLDPGQFHVSPFLVGQPDERFRKRPNTRFISLPPRLQTLRILRQFLFGSHDVLLYLKVAPASKWYIELGRISNDRRIVVGTVESRFDLRSEPTVPRGVALTWERTVLCSDYLLSNSQR